MKHGLNFKKSLINLFLAFVSICYVFTGCSSTSVQQKDAFDEFNQQKVVRPKKTPTPLPATNQKNEIQNQPNKHALKPEEQIEFLKKEIQSQPSNIKLTEDLAEEYYKSAQDEKVTALLWKSVDKLDRRGLILLAKAHQKRKEPGDMIRALNMLLSKNDLDFEAHTLMGDAHILNLKKKEALESYKRALEINRQYEPAYNGLISLYEKRTPPNLYELRILFQDMIEAIGRRPQYLRRLCEINTLDGTYESAIQMCNEAISKDSKVAEPYVYLGLANRANGDEPQGNNILRKAAEDFPQSELAQYNYAKILEEKKSYVEAVNTFKKATDANPQSARSWLGLAISSFEIRKFEISLIAYKNACRFDKKNAVAFRRATAILRNQKNSDWIASFEEASESCTF